MQPLKRDLVHRSRAAPYVQEWAFLDGNAPVNFTGASARMQLRHFEGSPGAALINLATVTTDILGIRFFKYRGDAILDAIRVRIPANNLAALPGLHTPEAGDPQKFSYDLLMTLSGKPEQPWLFGTFTLYPGVVA